MKKKMTVTIKDFSDQVLREMRSSVQAGLKAIGAEAEGYAKDDCPMDTGRLRNSISWATTTGNSSSGKGADGATQGQPEENTVYIGTNVEYGPKIEFRDMNHKVGKAHFLRDAMTTHSDHYKEILKAKLKSN